jgi:hypothetical protein
VASRVVSVRRGGRVRINWRLDQRTLRSLRAGTYVVRVQAGPSRKRIGRRAVERRLRITSPGRAAR